jgi:RimJ/RimL family protein N-acetyltransferase
VTDFSYPVGGVVEGWQARPWPEPEILEGRYVRVAPLTSTQSSELYAAVCGPGDADLWTYRPIPMPTSLQDLWMHLAVLVDAADVVPFTFIPKEGERDGRASGVAGYHAINPGNGSIEVGGVLFGPSLARTRAATEAIHLLMRYAFDELGYRRFEWKLDSLNEPSRRAAERLGFSYEGRFRNHMVVKGRNRDTDWFAVTAEEWPAVREGHERWLDPANFDDQGHQRSRLGS